jgi:hypothetical protein
VDKVVPQSPKEARCIPMIISGNWLRYGKNIFVSEIG